MIQIDISTLVKRLNAFSRQSLEMAATACMSQQATEITVSHVLLQMLAIPRCDLRVIVEKAEIGVAELKQALTVEHYATLRHTDSYPAFSPLLVDWLAVGVGGDAVRRAAWRYSAASAAALCITLCAASRRPSADRY